MKKNYRGFFLGVFLSYASTMGAVILENKTLNSSSEQKQSLFGNDYVYIVNNGELDLIVNNVLVPARQSLKVAQPVPVKNKILLIEVPHVARNVAMEKVPLKDADLGNTVKVGAYFDAMKKQYKVVLLRANKIPIMVTLHKKTRYIRIPRELRSVKRHESVI